MEPCPAYKRVPVEIKEEFNDGVCLPLTYNFALCVSLVYPTGFIQQLPGEYFANPESQCKQIRLWLKAHIDYDREHRKEST